MKTFFSLFLLSVLLLGCTRSGGFLLDFSPFARSPVYRMRPPEMYPDNPQAQALVKAALNDDIKEIDRLIDAGADPNAVGTFGMTVPGWLLRHQRKAGFRRLLERGADPNKIWYEGECTQPSLKTWKCKQSSLMHEAADLSPIIGLDYFKMCLEIGKGNPNLELPNRCYRLVSRTLIPGREQAFALLYNAGAEIDYFTPCPYGGHSAVHGAALQDNFRLMYFMLQRGVNYSHSGDGGLKNVHETIELTFYVGGVAISSPQYMWFWRCIDFLEKRGMVFDYTPKKGRKPAIRPAVLDTTPLDILDLEVEQ